MGKALYRAIDKAVSSNACGKIVVIPFLTRLDIQQVFVGSVGDIGSMWLLDMPTWDDIQNAIGKS